LKIWSGTIIMRFMSNKHHTLVEYKDGTFQWLRHTCESDALANCHVKRICSVCDASMKVDAKKRKFWPSEFHLSKS
jgi:hypothetical protein